jgi:hypothetical protein
MSEKEFTVSNSKLKTWRRCRKQFHYKYGLKLKPKTKSTPLVRGSILHDMIEAHIEGKDPWIPFKKAKTDLAKLKIMKEELAYYNELLDEVRRLMVGYLAFYEKDPIRYTSLKGKKAEHYFKVKLTESIWLEGYIDSFGQTKDRLNWLVEHKSHKQIPQGDLKYSDIQGALYVWVCQKIGLPEPDGVIWNYIKAKGPAIPELLKNGELSKRANADTIWPVYLESIKKHGLNPKDYKDMKLALENKEQDFFTRKLLPVNKTIVNTLVEDAKKTAREIKRKGNKDQTRNIDKHCEWCDYYNLCQAELRGLDTDFIIKTNFDVRDKNEKENQKNYWK